MTISSISEVLEGRSLNVIAPDATVRNAGERLKDAKADALAVVEGETLVGVLCEQDIIRKCVGQGLRSDDTQVADIMTPNPLTADADGRLADAFKAMVDNDIHHLPVLKDGTLVGMLLKGDIPTDYRMMVERFQEYRDNSSAA